MASQGKRMVPEYLIKYLEKKTSSLEERTKILEEKEPTSGFLPDA